MSTSKTKDVSVFIEINDDYLHCDYDSMRMSPTLTLYDELLTTLKLFEGRKAKIRIEILSE